MFARIFLFAVVAVALSACSGDPAPAPQPKTLADLHPAPAESEVLALTDAETCARVWGRLAAERGHDPEKTHRALTKFFFDQAIMSINDAFAREEFTQMVLPQVSQLVEQTPLAKQYSVLQFHEESRGPLRLIRSYDVDRKGFPAADFQFRDGWTAYPSSKHSIHRSCPIEFQYGGGSVGYIYGYQYPVADETRARTIEAHRADNDLQMRFVFEPISIGADRPGMTVRIKGIHFESKDGMFLGEVDKLPGA